MKPITAGFRIPSLREACQQNDAHRSSDAAAAIQTVALPYRTGKATLQLTGIHVRLQPTKAPAGATVVGAIAADIVVHVHVRGELNTAARSFVLTVIPVRYDTTTNITTAAAAAAGKAVEEAATSATSSAAAAAPYDKRVLNAQAREARRGVVAPVFASAFAKVDVRTQMERVRLSFTVVPSGKLSTGVAHRGKRGRDGDDAAEAPAPKLTSLVDCVMDVTVVGTVSAIA